MVGLVLTEGAWLVVGEAVAVGGRVTGVVVGFGEGAGLPVGTAVADDGDGVGDWVGPVGRSVTVGAGEGSLVVVGASESTSVGTADG